jgi:hypothetical protein
MMGDGKTSGLSDTGVIRRGADRMVTNTNDPVALKQALDQAKEENMQLEKERVEMEQKLAKMK